jgi:hypothetical protein
MAKRRKRAGRVTPAELAGQFATELPDREAMSLLMPSAGGLPIGGAADPGALPGGTTSAPSDAGTPYAGGATGTALDQTSTAQRLATTSGTSGTNVPNGTATASSAT